MACSHCSTRHTATNAGAPPATRTFFCDPLLSLCYNNTVIDAVTWPEARASCQAQGGDLLALSSAGKQKDVERYFRSRGTLSGEGYWHGARREGPGSDVVLQDGIPLSLVPSNAEPYAHWDWSVQVGPHTVHSRP
jgi:hypothetical protein